MKQKQPSKGDLRKVVLKICSKFTEEYQNRKVISIKLLCFATLLTPHFGMGDLLQICYIFSEHLFLRTTMEGCFLRNNLSQQFKYYTKNEENKYS